MNHSVVPHAGAEGALHGGGGLDDGGRGGGGAEGRQAARAHRVPARRAPLKIAERLQSTAQLSSHITSVQSSQLRVHVSLRPKLSV